MTADPPLTGNMLKTKDRQLCHVLQDEPHAVFKLPRIAFLHPKANEQRSERICSLGRKLSNISTNFSDTFSSQWLERTLDDSAIRRIDIPEMFLLTDALLILLDDITNGLVVFPAMIKSQLEQEIPFIATENIIMKLVQRGVSRQEAHERIRVLSRETIHAVKMEGGKNDLIERIKKDEFFVSLHFRLGLPIIGLIMAFTEAYLGRARWLAGPQALHWPLCGDCGEICWKWRAGCGQAGEVQGLH